MSHNLLCNPSFARLFVLSVIVHAMVFLAGGPQYIVYLFYIDMAVWTAAMRRKAWLSGLFTMGAVWFSALLMSAPQWLPAFWYLPHSARAGGVSSMSGLDFHPLKNLFLEALMPYPFGDDVTRGHLHFKNAWETSSYPGAAALILALAMLLRGAVWLGCRMARRGGCRTALSPLALAGITISLAGFYMAVGGWLPGFGGFRDVTKARAVMAFGVAIMSASQVDSLARKDGLISKYCFLAALGFMGLIIMGWAGSLNDPAQFEATVKSFGIPFDPAGHKDYEIFLADPRPALLRYHLAFQHALITGILIPAAVFGLMIIFRRRSRWISLLAGILVLAVSGDILLSNGNKWLARHPWIEAQLPLPIKEYFQQKLADSQTGFPWRVVLHPGIINRTHHLDGFYEYRGYDPLMPTGGVNRIMAKGAEKLSEQERPLFRTKALEKAGVRFDAENWLPGISDIPTTSIREFSAASLFEITRSVRLETLPTGLYGPDVDGYHYLDPDQSDRQLSDNVKASLAEMTSANPGAEPGSETETSASLQTARPDEFGIRIHLDKPGLVVFKNTWLPGWRVIVDGRDRGRALLANNWMCGAVVEKGPHDIIFRYRPVAWGFSWLLTAISACGLLACLFCRRLFPRFK